MQVSYYRIAGVQSIFLSHICEHYTYLYSFLVHIEQLSLLPLQQTFAGNWERFYLEYYMRETCSDKELIFCSKAHSHRGFMYGMGMATARSRFYLLGGANPPAGANIQIFQKPARNGEHFGPWAGGGGR